MAATTGYRISYRSRRRVTVRFSDDEVYVVYLFQDSSGVRPMDVGGVDSDGFYKEVDTRKRLKAIACLAKEGILG